MRTVVRLLVVLAILAGGYMLITTMCYEEVSVGAAREGEAPEDYETTIPPVPAFDESLSVIRTTPSGLKLRINNSTAVFKLDVTPFTPKEKKTAEVLSDDHIAVMKTAEKFDVPFLPSVELVDAKAKQFNDGLYAAIELYLQGEGTREAGTKTRFLRELLDRLLKFRKGVTEYEKRVADAAIVYVATGMHLGGQEVNLPDDLQEHVTETSERFTGSPIFSKPLGFYNWNEKLQAVYRQDRFYQRTLDIKDKMQTGAAVLISYLLLNDPALAQQHLRIVSLYSRLTNPLDALTVQDYGETIRQFESIHEMIGSPSGIEGFTGALKQTSAFRERYAKETGSHGSFARTGWSLILFSQLKETDLFNRLFGVRPPPPSVELMEIFIQKIKSGEIDLRPKSNSGWYDYQLHALETLLLPEKARESKKLVLTERYSERLKKAFKTMITKARETHVKQLRTASGRSAAPPTPEVIRPRLSLEPMATVYLRQARGYHFLRNVLPAILGEGVPHQLYRMRENDPPVEMNLKDELDRMMYLMYGLYAQACRDLGMKPDLMQGELSSDELKYALRMAEEWLKNLEEDTDLGTDTRVIVPVYINEVTGEVCYWATVGVKLMKIKVQYIYCPTVNLIEDDGRETPVKFFPRAGGPMTDGKLHGSAGHRQFKLEPQEYLIAVDVFKEIRRKGPPMTREKFRRFCDAKYGQAGFFSPALAVGVLVVILAAVGGVMAFRKRRAGRAREWSP